MKMNKMYYYLDEESQQIGPLSMEKLLKMRQAGIITDETLVWTEGLEKWVPLSTQLPTADGEVREKDTASSIPDEKENLRGLKEWLRKVKISGRKKQLALIGAGLMIPLLGGVVFAFSSSGEATPAEQGSSRRSNADRETPDMPKVKHKKETAISTETKDEMKKIEERALDKITQEEAFVELQKLGVVTSVLDIEGKQGKRALESAVEQGNFKVALLLVAGGAPVNSTDALETACSKRYMDIVKLLLSVPGIDVNRGNPLRNAVEKGNEDIVKLLMSVPDVDVNEGNPNPLLSAVRNGDEKIVKLLLASPKIDINQKDGSDVSPIFQSIIDGHINIAKLLLARPDVDVNVTLYLRYVIYSPLSLAVKNRQTEIVKSLLALPNVDINLGSPLAKAAANDDVELVKLFLARPDIDVNNGEPLTAAQSNEIVKLLLAHPDIDVNINDDRYTLLACAAMSGQTEIVKLLLARPNIDVNKDNPLEEAAKRENSEIVKLLLAHPDIDVNRCALLAKFAKQGNMEMVKFLLARSDIDVNMCDYIGGDGLNALQYAVYRGDVEMVKLLIAHPKIDLYPQLSLGGGLCRTEFLHDNCPEATKKLIIRARKRRK